MLGNPTSATPGFSLALLASRRRVSLTLCDVLLHPVHSLPMPVGNPGSEDLTPKLSAGYLVVSLYPLLTALVCIIFVLCICYEQSSPLGHSYYEHTYFCFNRSLTLPGSPLIFYWLMLPFFFCGVILVFSWKCPFSFYYIFVVDGLGIKGKIEAIMSKLCDTSHEFECLVGI